MVACVFDSTFLLLLTDDVAAAPTPKSPPPERLTGDNSPPDGLIARDRLKFLIKTLDDQRSDVVVPTPVLTEVLASARADVANTLHILNSLARIRFEGFGQRAAIECAEMLRRNRKKGPRGKVKFDHQIVAIAKVVHATMVYSDDRDVQALCKREKLACRGVWELPQRPVDPQRSLKLGKDDSE